MDGTELLDQKIRCPNCRFGTLIRESLHKWKCPTCGYWTVNQPGTSNQGSRSPDRGRSTPLSTEQREAIQSGREQWDTLVKVGKRAALAYVTIFLVLTLGFNVALWEALQTTSSVTWTITAWTATGFLGLLDLIIFYISSTKRKIVYGLVFGLILTLFITTVGM